jgi:hypothetical protein
MSKGSYMTAAVFSFKSFGFRIFQGSYENSVQLSFWWGTPKPTRKSGGCPHPPLGFFNEMA